MELLALTAPLYILNGEPQNAAAVSGLLAQPAPGKAARGREHDYLFAHLSLSGPVEETNALYGELIASLSALFYASTGSVTSALRRAVLDLNERLLRHNLTTRSSHEGALTCAVLHGTELYMLQVGEALAFLGHNFGVERLPMPQPGGTVTPLGRSAGIDIRFAYHVLQVGDMLLLADPRVAYLNGPALGPVLVDAEIETGVEELIALVGNDSARLLLVEFTDEMPSTLPVAMTRKVAPPAAKSSKGKKAAAAATVAATTPGPVREAGQPPIRQAGATSAAGSAARGAAAQSARGLSAATAWAAGLLGQPDADQDDDDSAFSWALPAFLAILIPIVIGVVVSSVYLQRGNVQRVGEIKQSMVEEMLLAEQAADDGEARARYTAALALAAEGETLRPGDGEITRMRLDARANLDRLDGVSRLDAVVFDQYAEGSNLTDIAVRAGEGGVFILDEAGNRVYLRQTNTTYDDAADVEPSLVGFGGQVVGNQVIGPIVDMMWRAEGDAASREGLNMLDRTGVLFIYYPNLGDMRAVPLGFGSTWINPVAMADYSGRLYVLDAGAQQIWKYFPSGEGYIQDETDKAISFSTESNLGDAVDFDIYSEDASVVIIYKDGRIRYFDTRSGRVQWDEQTLMQNGLGSPLVAPTAVALVGKGLNASIFVLDPGSGRIVQIARGGTVLAQYRALDEEGNELLPKSSGFAVVDSPLRIFVSAGDRVYLATRE